MCILRARYRAFKKQGVTALELIIVIIIIGIIATLGIGGWHAQLEHEHGDNAKATLQAVWQAEQDFLAWKDRYTEEWGVLEIDNPNNTDRYYTYDIEIATDTALLIRATRKGKSTGFTISEDGTINSF